MKSDKQKRAMRAKQADLKAYGNERRKRDLQRLLNSGSDADYLVGVKVVGHIELPDDFMLPAFMKSKPKPVKVGSPSKGKNKRSKFLMRVYAAAEGLCYYCGQHCVLTLPNTQSGVLPMHGATVEHLYPKDDIRRRLMGQWENIALACYKCNQESNERFLAEYIEPYDEKWEPWIVGILLPNNQIPTP